MHSTVLSPSARYTQSPSFKISGTYVPQIGYQHIFPLENVIPKNLGQIRQKSLFKTEKQNQAIFDNKSIGSERQTFPLLPDMNTTRKLSHLRNTHINRTSLKTQNNNAFGSVFTQRTTNSSLPTKEQIAERKFLLQENDISQISLLGSLSEYSSTKIDEGSKAIDEFRSKQTIRQLKMIQSKIQVKVDKVIKERISPYSITPQFSDKANHLKSKLSPLENGAAKLQRLLTLNSAEHSFVEQRSHSFTFRYNMPQPTISGFSRDKVVNNTGLRSEDQDQVKGKLKSHFHIAHQRRLQHITIHTPHVPQLSLNISQFSSGQASSPKQEVLETQKSCPPLEEVQLFTRKRGGLIKQVAQREKQNSPFLQKSNLSLKLEEDNQPQKTTELSLLEDSESENGGKSQDLNENNISNQKIETSRPAIKITYAMLLQQQVEVQTRPKNYKKIHLSSWHRKKFSSSHSASKQNHFQNGLKDTDLEEIVEDDESCANFTQNKFQQPPIIGKKINSPNHHTTSSSGFCEDQPLGDKEMLLSATNSSPSRSKGVFRSRLTQRLSTLGGQFMLNQTHRFKNTSLSPSKEVELVEKDSFMSLSQFTQPFKDIQQKIECGKRSYVIKQARSSGTVCQSLFGKEQQTGSQM
ncbi:hypothetical protein FGO68_gene12184 [Halteria grandinella]|uniref:Uncharacterized protein n=1 Tax=Halteria grandinella TaxID=5974 RepID=A0A8J8NTD9_HALGN|nr:hypothetical protein FGO68_gene12184 [Halteria grandinella]